VREWFCKSHGSCVFVCMSIIATAVVLSSGLFAHILVYLRMRKYFTIDVSCGQPYNWSFYRYASAKQFFDEFHLLEPCITVLLLGVYTML